MPQATRERKAAPPRVTAGPADGAPPGRLPGLLPDWLPDWVVRRPETVVALGSFVGLFVQVVGYSRGWSGDDGTTIGFWYVGFALIVVPYIGLLLVEGRSAHQRLGAALGLTLTLYGSWLLTNPLMSTRFDENLHVTTLVDLVDKAEFFQLNSMLPVSPHFPGLELATAGVHWLTGLPLFACQVIVVATARITFVTALFLLASRIGRSPRVGGFAVLVYAASTQFYFFNAQYSYQTVAISMVMAAFYLLTRAFDSPDERPWRLLLSVQACLGALAITHHLTSWIMLATLWALVLLFAIGRERRKFQLTLVTAELATAIVAGWTAVIAPLLIDYLTPIFNGAASQLTGILNGGESREIGSAGDGSAAPTWQLMVMAVSVLAWCFLLLPSGWRAWRRGSIGSTRARYLPLLIALAFPVTQASRFSSTAGEIGDRASTFIFMALALVVGAWLAHSVDSIRLWVLPGALVVLLGGTILGSGPDWQRVPGPYLAGAEQRSIDSTSVEVAQWVGRYVPDGSNMAADTTFGRLLPNFADVNAVTQPGGFDSVTEMFISERMDQYSLSLILRNDVDFVVVDTRLLGRTALSGCFFEGCTGFGDVASTVTRPMIDKFDTAPGFQLVLDGPVRIYDVRAVRGVPATFEDRPDPGLPGTWQPLQVLFTGALLLVVVLLRRRLLDPRRFRADDAYRFALVLPAAMAIGVLGVLVGFSPVAGGVAAAGLVLSLVRSTRQPDPLGPRPGAEAVIWTVLVAVLLTATVGLAVRSTQHGLLDGEPLPPPLAAGVASD